MITALYANTNYDGKENHQKREQILQKIEDSFKETVARLYDSSVISKEQKEKEEMENNPFFQAVERGLKRQGIPDLDKFLDEEETEIDQY